MLQAKHGYELTCCNNFSAIYGTHDSVTAMEVKPSVRHPASIILCTQHKTAVTPHENKMVISNKEESTEDK